LFISGYFDEIIKVHKFTFAKNKIILDKSIWNLKINDLYFSFDIKNPVIFVTDENYFEIEIVKESMKIMKENFSLLEINSFKFSYKENNFTEKEDEIF